VRRPGSALRSIDDTFAARAVAGQRAHGGDLEGRAGRRLRILRRQYTTIGSFGLLLFVVLIPLQSIEVAVGFAIGGCLPPPPASSA